MSESIKNINELLNALSQIGFTLFFSILGAFIYEILSTMTARSMYWSFSRMIVSSVCGGMFSILIVEYTGDKFVKSLAMYAAICFITGLVGSELSLSISKLKFWTDRFNFFKK